MSFRGETRGVPFDGSAFALVAPDGTGTLGPAEPGRIVVRGAAWAMKRDAVDRARGPVRAGDRGTCPLCYGDGCIAAGTPNAQPPTIGLVVCSTCNGEGIVTIEAAP